ncbi:MAG: hypothetical protein VXX85_00595 [Candidatus Margulisiibacteriota bacterium]|nr:hypothetical protein [Candidatus Margulisiibacteriota bacterium]
MRNKMAVVFNLSIIFSKLESSTPIFSYKNLTIYELKHGSDYRIFIGKQSNGSLILIQTLEGTEVSHKKDKHINQFISIIHKVKKPIMFNKHS